MTATTTEPTDALNAFRLDGQVAVVTGASSGLGHRFVRVLHGAGATVVAAARRKERLTELAAGLPNCEPVVVDVEDDASLVELAERVESTYGGVDVLVNNAGVGGAAAAEIDPIDRFRRVVEVNLVALYRLSQLLVQQMFARGGGSVVNVGSVFGLVGGGELPLAAYCASKSGVHGLTRDLAVQWARRNVRVNALAPGYFRSEMTAARLDRPDAGPWIERNAPMGRTGEAHELDGALLFLASAASSYLTGQVVVVDGGWTAR